MDFFEHQQSARRRTWLLVAYFSAALMGIVGAIYTVTVILIRLFFLELDWALVLYTGGLWDPRILLWVALATTAVVGGGSLYQMSRLSSGGEAVARMLGGRKVDYATASRRERRLLNVVEEISIASGCITPAVYVLDGSKGINAFAAGYSMGDAAVAVTEGCLNLLSRAELQGVIAHEFSHILNGDSRIKLRMLGLIHGIQMLGMFGRAILRQRRRSLPMTLLAAAFVLIGGLGVFFGKLIQSAISRQREFLADAAAVQFTRNPYGLAGALKKIGGYFAGSTVGGVHVEEASHLFFSEPLLRSWMASHPPLSERVRRLDPSFCGEFPVYAGQPPVDIDEEAPLSMLTEPSATPPRGLVEQVGRIDPEHLQAAAALLARLPRRLRDAVHDGRTAQALSYAMLLDGRPKVRADQEAYLRKAIGEDLLAEVRRLNAEVQALGTDVRLPLVQISLPALRGLPVNEQEVFRHNIVVLMRADRQTDLFEHALDRVLLVHLDKRPTKPVRYIPRPQFVRAIQVVLSAIAHAGARHTVEAEQRFAAGVGAIKLKDAVMLLPADRCSATDLDPALDLLSGAPPGQKKKIVEAAAACVTAGQRKTTKEIEMLRALASVLDCPVPLGASQTPGQGKFDS